MELHEVWHVALLATTLLGGAGLVLVLLIPILFEEAPAGFERARPVVYGLVAAAAALLLGEWLGVH